MRLILASVMIMTTDTRLQIQTCMRCNYPGSLRSRGPILKTITKAVLEGPSDGKNIFFLDAPAGSGKTFFTELMIQALRFKGRLLIPVASTGIEALLLEKGVTAHKCDIIFWDDTCNSEKALQCRLYYIVSTIIFDSKQSPCLLLLSFAALIT